MYLCLTFCADVLSSARQVARFLAHWPSCIAAAWSVTVGTEDLAEVTILLPGYRVRKKMLLWEIVLFNFISR